MKAKRRHKKSSPLFRIVIVAVIAFGFFKLVQIQMQINEKQAVIDELAERKAVEEIYVEDLQDKVDNIEENLEQYLREDGYVGPNDQVYQFVN